MWQATTVAELRQQRAALRGRVAFVPTMGALHEGHLSLMRTARQHADHVLVSIFVNPTQFAPTEDLGRYPRTLEADLQGCTDQGVAGVFVPSVEEVYPPGEPACDIDVPSLTGILEGQKRPTHFAGVCRVVAKLFGMVQPDCAVFGRKDYQQLCVIRAMTRSLAMPIDIIASETVRESDGLAMSSRNRYLDAAQRQQAVGLHQALTQAKAAVQSDKTIPVAAVEQRMADVIQQHHFDLDYAVARHADTLQPIDTWDQPAVALVAARMGKVRLIDNAALNEQ